MKVRPVANSFILNRWAALFSAFSETNSGFVLLIMMLTRAQWASQADWQGLRSSLFVFCLSFGFVGGTLCPQKNKKTEQSQEFNKIVYVKRNIFIAAHVKSLFDLIYCFISSINCRHFNKKKITATVYPTHYKNNKTHWLWIKTKKMLIIHDHQ